MKLSVALISATECSAIISARVNSATECSG